MPYPAVCLNSAQELLLQLLQDITFNNDFFFSFSVVVVPFLIRLTCLVSDLTRTPSSHWSRSCWTQGCRVSAGRPSNCWEPGLRPTPPNGRPPTTWSRSSKAPVWTGGARRTTCCSTTRTRSPTELGRCSPRKRERKKERKTCDTLQRHMNQVPSTFFFFYWSGEKVLLTCSNTLTRVSCPRNLLTSDWICDLDVGLFDFFFLSFFFLVGGWRTGSFLQRTGICVLSGYECLLNLVLH